MHPTFPLLRKTDFPTIHRKTLDTLQVNLGYKCNQTCQHCHVNAGPTRTEMMDFKTVELVLEVLQAKQIRTLDLTGGAPEMNMHFRTLVQQARALGVQVIDRCNLTILFEPGHQDLAQFLADNQVEVTASMPCYSQENVDKQRGEGTFDKSIEALQLLNRLGYGKADGKLSLSLVYNPQGPSLPPEQKALEQDYKRELLKHFDITFNHLFVLANMPIQRFGSTLISKGLFSGYMTLLKNNFSAANVDGVMCRSLVSVDWQGFIYDCDFNQMLAMPMPSARTGRRHLSELLTHDITGDAIAIADHCYGCTAGQGSSCGGALAA
ncbi:MAG: arsenosugar biosynthesis radical SAM protein ArsS [Herminiimonas sp.]|nr:arsenosugar biosynthesis radical SAM protein ArsS [Herminiimonas sp.]